MFKTHPFLLHTLGNAFIFVILLSVLSGACNPPANHAAWKIIPGKNSRLTSNEFNGITAITNNNVWAVGESFGDNSDQPLTEHWNGITWQIVPTPDRAFSSSLRAVAAIPGTDQVWAVGTQYTRAQGIQPLIERWNGKAWQIVPTPFIKYQVGSGTNTLHSIIAISKDNAWATGMYSQYRLPTALIEHWNGKQWSIVPGASVPGNPHSTILTSITALTANNIWAVGTSTSFNGLYTFKTLTEHWDGHTWHYVPSPNPGTGSNVLDSVTSIPGTNQLLAVGELDNTNQRSQILTERWNGKSWQVISSTNGKTPGMVLVSVTARSAHDAWGVGEGTGGLIAHWDGTNWKIVSHPTPAKLMVFSAITSVPKTNTFWTVGSYSATGSTTSTLIERYS